MYSENVPFNHSIFMSEKLKDIMTGFYVKLNLFAPKEIIPSVKIS